MKSRFIGKWFGSAHSAAIAGVLISLAMGGPQVNAETKVLLSPKERPDLATKVGPTLCKSTRPISPQQAWALGIFDSQLEVKFFRPLSGIKATGNKAYRSPLTLEALGKRARAMAKRNRHAGFAFGLCHSGLGWAMTSPSSETIRYDGARHVLLLPESMNQRCKSYRVDFAGSQEGRAARLTVKGLKVKVGPGRQGTLSVTCLPVAPSWAGPVLWYMGPAGGKGQLTVPSPELLATNGDPLDRLARWIDQIRSNASLDKLDGGGGDLNEAVDLLSLSGTIKHNRNVIRSAKKLLKKSGMEFLGELRVKGTNLMQLAMLLWSSPGHRDLLLHREGTHIGLHLSESKDELLVVAAITKKQALSLSKGEDKSKKPL